MILEWQKRAVYATPYITNGDGVDCVFHSFAETYDLHHKHDVTDSFVRL